MVDTTLCIARFFIVFLEITIGQVTISCHCLSGTIR